MGKSISPGAAVVVIIIVVIIVLVVGYFAFLRPKGDAGGPSPEEVDAMMGEGQVEAVGEAGEAATPAAEGEGMSPDEASAAPGGG